MDRNDAAKVLHLEGIPNVDIAKMFKVSENTVSGWAKKGNWKEAKRNQSLMKDNAVSTIVRLIDYQTAALDRKVQSWIAEDPQSIKLIDRGDIDALQKLFTTIKKDSKKYVDYVTVVHEFFDFLQHQNLNLAKGMMEMAHIFLEEKRKLL